MRNILPHKSIDAGDLSASITGSATNISHITDVAYQGVFTGSPVGALGIEGSIDGVNYVEMDTKSIAGAGSVLFDLPLLSFCWIRPVYTRTSGSGALTVWIFAKGRD